jgi:acetyl-CoA synthetase
MSEHDLFPVPADWAERALVDEAKYNEMYAQSVADPEAFWGEHGKRIDWIKPYTQVKDVSYAHQDVHIRWYHDGTLNASVNCLDRHLETRGDQTAIIWEGDDPADSRKLTYRELYEEVCKFSNVLKANGAKKGDRITIYLPMIPEIAVAVLACARIGAIHSVIFGGFSPDSIAGRIHDSDSTLIVTSDEGVRGGRPIPLKANVDAALTKCPTVEKCIVVKRTGKDIDWVDGRDVWYHEAMADAAAECAPEEMNAEDPLFILYTSGLHRHAKGRAAHDRRLHGLRVDDPSIRVRLSRRRCVLVHRRCRLGHRPQLYRLRPARQRRHDADLRRRAELSRFLAFLGSLRQAPGQHLLHRADRDPRADARRRRAGRSDQPVHRCACWVRWVSRSIPKPGMWYHNVVGNGRCPIVDTWWQTETGGILITPLPGATALKPGSATKPFFGVKPEIVDAEGNVLEGATEGNLILTDSWPGQMRTVYGDHDRFVLTYFSTYKGNYFTGDGCRRDEDGYYWITGRVDDVINVSGHRMGTAEVESSLVGHSDVAEAAVVGYPHDIKGQGIYAYVTLMEGHEPSEELRKELVQWVRKDIGPIASPDLIQWAPGLPKTRSGKIMRRILRKIAANEHDQLGDTSTLADPAVVDDLVENRQNR